ncbi:dihydrodipicolinate synthase family protein [Halegenticoccus tardaugens]|uniref:dihydrodipicolinate synthase family protein n=1 Tax=Halegenticoccus tardaugens TaxID=2071624 RepID=UPI00100A76A9|nr:dihydrodipicolinate synthase family protein [Halegenticoccus tardaugens]
MQRQPGPTQLETGLRNVATGILTPFSEEDKEIRYDALRSNVQSLYDAGVRTFLACANISEYHSLSHEERIMVTEESVDALADDACVLAGAGGSLKTATRLVEAFERVGVDGIMVIPPMHAYKHEQGLLRYYRELAQVSDTGVLPYIRGFSPSVEFLAALTRIDNVAGIKYALDDIVTFREAISAGDTDVIWVAVTETLAPEFYMEGAEGFTAGVSNFRPEIGLSLMEALEAGDYERAKEIRDITLEYQRFRTERGQNNTFDGAISIPAVKYGLELAGFTGGVVRPPLVELSQEDRARAEEMYHRIETADV